MGLSQVLEALPAFTLEERQLLVRRVIELDDPPLSEADETRWNHAWQTTTQIPHLLCPWKH